MEKTIYWLMDNIALIDRIRLTCPDIVIIEQ